MIVEKADRPHPHNYPHMPTDHRHTDKHLRLVMTLIALMDRRTYGWTDEWTDGCYQVHYLPASWSINIILVDCLISDVPLQIHDSMVGMVWYGTDK